MSGHVTGENQLLVWARTVCILAESLTCAYLSCERETAVCDSGRRETAALEVIWGRHGEKDQVTPKFKKKGGIADLNLNLTWSSDLSPTHTNSYFPIYNWDNNHLWAPKSAYVHKAEYLLKKKNRQFSKCLHSNFKCKRNPKTLLTETLTDRLLLD